MSSTQLLLIDLSSLAHPLYAMSGNEPDPDWTSTQIVARVRALSSAHPHAAICCDSGKSFRNDLAPRVANGDGTYTGYKANRPERDERLHHQIRLAVERLQKDDYPVWKCDGFEADDVIASATTQALAIDGATVLIATADKDLLQLVSERVTVKNVAPQSKGEIRDTAAVLERFGVAPSQMLDWLCLVGDSSDNVKGAEGIGPKRATELLAKHGTLEHIYTAIDRGIVPGVTPTMRTNLQDFRARWPLTRELIALRTDVPVPLEEIAVEREAKPMDKTLTDMTDEEFSTFEDVDSVAQSGERLGGEGAPAVAESPRAEKVAGSTPAAVPQGERTAQQCIDEIADAAVKADAVVKAAQRQGYVSPSDAMRNAQSLVAYQPAPVLDFSQQLEPRNMDEAVRLADRMFKSRHFSAYGTPESVLATILAGRELGIPAMASLRAFHIIESKPTLSADTLAALVMRSGKAKYFRCTERTAERATFVTQRLPVEDYPEQKVTVTIQEMRDAWRKDEKAWTASGWGKTPAAMLVARAKSALARLEYPDVVGNLYGFEEFD